MSSHLLLAHIGCDAILKVSMSHKRAACRRAVTDNAIVQPGEILDHPPFDCSKKGYTNPMVEIKAGVNVWHQVRVHKETANELRISYPGMQIY